MQIEHSVLYSTREGEAITLELLAKIRKEAEAPANSTVEIVDNDVILTWTK